MAIFPLSSDPLPDGIYTIGSDGFNLEEIRTVLPHIPRDAKNSRVLAHTYPRYHLVPKLIFLNLFPPNFAVLNEIQE